MESRSNKPFATALADALRERTTDPMGRVNLREFFRTVEGRWGYDSLRAMVTGDRTLQNDCNVSISGGVGPSSHIIGS